MMGMPEANRTMRSRWPSVCWHQLQAAVARPQTRNLKLALVVAAVACEPSNTATKAVVRPAASGAYAGDAGDAGSRALSARAKAEPVPPVAAAAPARPRVFVKTRFVWIRPVPDATKDWIGFLWAGAAVELKTTVARPGPGCPAFYAIEPRGYVCVDGENTTLDQNDPVYRALVPYAPKLDSPWLHRYAESRGLVRYRSLPTAELQHQQEPDLAAHLKDISLARSGKVSAELEGVDLTLPVSAGFQFPDLPRTLFEKRRTLSNLSTLAYSDEARFGQRGFLLAADYTWVPKDRVKPYPTLNFRGVRLGVDANLPLAFFRKPGHKYVRGEGKAFRATSETFERLALVELTGKLEYWRGQRYFETREPAVWLREIEAVVPEPRTKTPWGAKLGAADTTGRAPRGRGTWIEISIEGGWLLAVEGTRPVYATLMSPGMGGMAGPDQDALDSSASPTGTYPISGKLVTATMESPDDLVHSDVPFVQNIVKPYALHGAYWHDNWGNPQSGGCINLAPIDAKWLFEFSEPELPKGWHAVRWSPNAPTTIVVLHR